MKTKLVFYFLIVILLFSCSNQEKRMITYTGFIQGTTFSIKFFAFADSIKMMHGIDSILLEMNRTASTYDKISIISKANNNQDVELNGDFVRIFNKSKEISDLTSGCFDITVGELVQRWGFGFTNSSLPSEKEVEDLLKYVGYKNVGLDGNRLIKKFPETHIDFNAIAQGYTVDLVSEYLMQNSCIDYIVEIGGEVRANGTKKGGKPWVVAIEKPDTDDSLERSIQLNIALENQAISTSGNYRKYFIKDGIRYSHTIDPQTGYPVHHSLLSVSVIADDCATADAYATAFMVMGVEKAKVFLEKHSAIEAYLIYSDASKTNQVFYTPNFFK
jgi:thiamine biosynthesis lipoprotein